MRPNQHSNLLKIFDGLYVGDQYSIYDSSTISLNYINFAILTHQPSASHLIPHLHYHQIHSNYEEIFIFIEKSKILGECCLIYGKDLQIPSIVLTSYLMIKFNWSMFKALEFVHWRLPDVHFDLQPLKALETKLVRKGKKLNESWQKHEGIRIEELIIRNTFLNSKISPIKTQNKQQKSCQRISTNPKEKRVKWALMIPTSKSPKRYESIKTLKVDSDKKKQKIILNVMDVIVQSKNVKKNSTKSIKINRSRTRLPNFQFLGQQKKVKSLNSSINLRSKTELEDDDKENTRFFNSRGGSIKKNEQNYKNILVQETVKKLKQMKASMKTPKNLKFERKIIK